MDTNLMLYLSTAEGLVLALDPLPEPVWQAWERYSAIKDRTPEKLELIEDLAAATTPDEFAAIIDRHTAARVKHDAERGVLDETKTYLARLLIGAVASSGVDLISTNLVAPFAEAAEQFTEAHAKLPGNYHDPAVLLHAAPETLAHFQRARAAADVLDTLAAHRRSIATLMGESVQVDREVWAGTTFVAVTNYAAARRMVEAMRTTTRDNPLGPWGAAIETKGFVGFHMLTPAEHAAYVQALDPAENHYERTALGHRLVEV